MLTVQRGVLRYKAYVETWKRNRDYTTAAQGQCDDTDTVTITDNTTGKTIECPVYRGTYGPAVIDTQRLYSELGMFTFDPGFVTTASCRSAITFLCHGDKGILLYRGYPIEQLAEHSHFLEVAYLLIYGELPTARQMAEFDSSIKEHSMVHEHLINFYGGYRYDAHPMSIMVGVIGAMASYYHDSIDIYDQGDRDATARRIIAKMSNIASSVTSMASVSLLCIPTTPWGT